MNATLSVKPSASVEPADTRFVDTGMTVMGSDHVITFGALNRSRFEINTSNYNVNYFRGRSCLLFVLFP